MKGQHTPPLLRSRRLALVSALAAAALTAAVLTATTGARSAAAPPTNTAVPAIAGTAQVGATLTASPGTWTGDAPITFAYAWDRCNTSGASCSVISGATASTYLLASADAGSTVRVVLTASNAAGIGSASSSATTTVSSSSAPINSALPTLSGTTTQGQTLAVSTGTWSGPTPITFTYKWQRCDAAGSNCVDASAVITTNMITLASADVGKTIRGIVIATNGSGATTVTSGPSAVVATISNGPTNTALPSISGTALQGQSLVLNAGAWAGPTPITFTYQWRRCDSIGNNCADASTVITTPAITLASADIGKTIRGIVVATNANGSTTATSAPTAIVAAPSSLPGATTLADGRISVPVTSVSLPERLVISRVQFQPGRLITRSPFTLTVWVTDTKGHAVRDALVLATMIPYGWAGQPAETTTAADGTVTFTVKPTINMPVRRSALLAFVRARNPSEDILAGVSTRRLIQVSIG